MSSWDDFKADAEKVASKVATKTGELADAASLRLRLQSLKLKLCEAYERLGRAVYSESVADADKGEATTDHSSLIAEIDRLRVEIEKIQAEIKK